MKSTRRKSVTGHPHCFWQYDRYEEHWELFRGKRTPPKQHPIVLKAGGEWIVLVAPWAEYRRIGKHKSFNAARRAAERKYCKLPKKR